jgi:antitoxin component YwqK of YwqJK toxin-antitoxin module
MEKKFEWINAFIGVVALLLFSCEPNRMEVVEVFDNNAPKEAYEISPNGEKKTFYSWHRNGIKAEEMPYENGVPSGTYRKWGITGFIIESGNYKDSLREGKWTFFAKEKVPYIQGFYKNGLKQGKWTILDEKGKITGEQFYKDDSAAGTWKKFHNDVLIEENSCHPSNQVGYFRSYSNEGKALVYQECRYGKLDGIFMSYYPGGSLHKVGHFKSGFKNGFWVEYFAKGNLRKIENWAFAMRDGEWARFSESGEVLARAEFMDGNGFFEDTSWRNNRIHGQLRTSFKNGEYFRIETYESGIKQRTEDYLRDSTRLALGFWKDGRKDGAWRTWYRSGVLKDSLNFKGGELFGEQFHYDSTGRLYKKENRSGKNMPNFVEVF